MLAYTKCDFFFANPKMGWYVAHAWLIDCHAMKNGSREVKKESRIVRMKKNWVGTNPTSSSRGAQEVHMISFTYKKKKG
jgi:hypothetical protein